MVELELTTHTEKLVPHCYVAFRVGDSQKMGRLSKEKMYAFPDSIVQEHKYAMLDVFQRIGGCTVSLKPVNVDQEVNLKTKVGHLNFNVTALELGATKPNKKEQPVVAKDSTKNLGRMDAAKAYLEKHNLERRLKEALQTVVTELPEDPIAFITERMRESQGVVTQKYDTSVDTLEAPVPNSPLQVDKLNAEIERLRDELSKATAAISEVEQLRSENKQLQADLLIAIEAEASANCEVERLRNEVLSLTVEATNESRQAVVQPSEKSHPQWIENCRLEEEIAQFELLKTEIIKEEVKEELTVEQIELIEVVFSEFDVGATGKIATSQLRDVLCELGQNLSEAELQQIMSEEVDVDGTGLLTCPELLLVMARLAKETEATQELISAFKLLDRDGLGLLPVSKLSDMFTEAEIKDLLTGVPVDGAGNINYVEFAKVMVAKDYCEGFC